jgi:hypothetical protein
MHTKLTVSIDQLVIDRAKNELQTKEHSLSRLIEDYFVLLLNAQTKHIEPTPIVSELTGIAKTTKKTTTKELITEYLMDKYL